MKLISKPYHMAILGAAFLVLWGCQRDFDPSIKNKLLIPLVHSELSIDDILADSLQEVQADGSVSLVYRNEIYSNSMSAFNTLDTREFEETAKLQKLTLSPKSAVRSVSLGQVAEADGGATGAFIIAQNGNMSIIPPIAGLTYGPLSVDGTEFFETVTLDSGYMDVTIENQFPTDLSNIDFEIRNEGDNSLVGSETFALVEKNSTETKTIDLAGKTVDGQLLGNLLNFDIVGSGASQVLIDTSDQVIVTITVRDMKVNSATAIFPAQEVIGLKDTNQMRNVDDLKLTAATAKTGLVRLNVASTINDTMYFHYLIPNGTKDGVPFEIYETIPPAPVGGSISRVYEYPIQGVRFDLTGAPLYNTYNAFYSELSGRIDSTGKLVSMSLNDSLLIGVQLVDFVPEHVEGYLANVTADVGPESVPVSLFDKIKSGTIEFEQVDMAVSVINANGAPFSVDMKTITAKNSSSGKSADIVLTSLPNPLTVDRAPSQDVAWTETWNLDKSSGNFTEALNIFPDELEVELTVESNPGQDSNDLSQFAIDSNLLQAFVDMELPLSFIADELVVQDTLDFNPSSISNPAGISSGVLYLIGYNDFPVEAELELQFMDDMDVLQETVSFDKAMAAGGQNATEKTVLEWSFSQETIGALMASHKVVFTAKLNSTSLTEHQKIYSDQLLDLTLSARFNYAFEN